MAFPKNTWNAALEEQKKREQQRLAEQRRARQQHQPSETKAAPTAAAPVSAAPRTTTPPKNSPLNTPKVVGARSSGVGVESARTPTPPDPYNMNYVERALAGRQLGLGQDFWDSLSADMDNPGSRIYNPYFRGEGTIPFAKEVFGQTSFDRDWLDANVGLREHEVRSDYSYGLSTPNKKFTPQQLAAWVYNQIDIAEENTQKAESEWASMLSDAQDFYTTYSLNHGTAPSYEEFESSIDMSKYPMLAKVDESRNLGTTGSQGPLRFNRGLGYSRENLYGVYHALAQKRMLDPSTDYFEDAVSFVGQPDQSVVQSFSRPKKTTYSSWEGRIPDATPEQLSLYREDVRTKGDRKEDYALTQEIYKQNNPDYNDYGMSEYVDDAYFKKYDPIYDPIIEKNLTFDANGNGVFYKPDKSAPPSVQAAYLHWQRKDNEQASKAVEREWAKLRAEIAVAYRNWKPSVDASENPVEAVRDLVDWSNYAKLTQYLEGKIRPNRPVYATNDSIDGWIREVMGLDKAGLEHMRELAVAGSVVGSDDIDYAYAQGKGGATAQEAAQRPVQGPPEADGTKPTYASQTAPAASGEPTEASAPQPKAAPPELDDNAPVSSTGLNLSSVPESAWPMLVEAGVFLQSQIDDYRQERKQRSMSEETGMVPGEFKAQSAVSFENEDGDFVAPDTGIMSKQDLLDTLKAVNASIVAGQDFDATDKPNPVVVEHEDQLRALSGIQSDILYALEQMGMTDEEIEFALGTKLYSDSGEPLTYEQAQAAEKAASIEKSVAAYNKRKADEAAAAEAEVARQEEVAAVREELKKLDENVDLSDPVAVAARNQRFSALNARLHDLGVGATMGARPELPEGVKVYEIKPRQLWGSKEDWLDGVLDRISEAANHPFIKVLKDPSAENFLLASTHALGQMTPENTAPLSHLVAPTPISDRYLEQLKAESPGGELSDEDWKKYYEVLGVERQQIDQQFQRMFQANIDNMLPLETPQLVKDAMIFAAAGATGVVERTASEALALMKNVVSFLYSGVLLSNHQLYEQRFGEDYTAAQARSIDPVADAFANAVIRLGGNAEALRVDHSQEMGPFGNELLSWYEGALDLYAMIQSGKLIAPLASASVGGVLDAIAPAVDKLPKLLRTLAGSVGKTAEWLAAHSHWQMRAYANFAQEAREEGYSEEDVNKYGLFGMAVSGWSEGIFGDFVEKSMQVGSQIFAQKVVKGAWAKLQALKVPVMDYLKLGLMNSFGEMLEEMAEVPATAVGKERILGKEIAWPSFKDMFQTLGAGLPYENEMLTDMVKEGLSAFGSTLFFTLTFGLSGASGDSNHEAQAERVLGILMNAGPGVVSEAAELDVRSEAAESASPSVEPERPAVKAETAVAPESPKVEPESEAAPEAPARPVEPSGAMAEDSAAVPAEVSQEAPAEPQEAPPGAPEPEAPAPQPKKSFWEDLSVLTDGALDASIATTRRAIEAREKPSPRLEAQLAALEAEKASRTAAASEPAPAELSAEAKELVAFKKNMGVAAEKAVIEEEATARTEEDKKNGLLDETNKPTHPTFFALMKLDAAMASLQRAKSAIEAKIDGFNKQMRAMVKTAVDTMVPIESGPNAQTSWNLREMMDKAGRDLESLMVKIEDAAIELKLMREKHLAEQAEIEKARKQEHKKQLEEEAEERKSQRIKRSKEFVAWLDGVIRDKLDAYGKGQSGDEETGEYNPSDNEEDSEAVMYREKDEEVRSRSRFGTEALESKLEVRRSEMNTGAPKGPDGFPMISVPKKIFLELQKMLEDVDVPGLDKVKKHFQRRSSQKAEPQNSVTRAWTAPLQPKKQQGVTGESGKPKGASVSSWPSGTTYSVVGQTSDYYIVEDLEYTRKNASLLDEIEAFERTPDFTDKEIEVAFGVKGYEFRGQLEALKEQLSPRYYIVPRDARLLAPKAEGGAREADPTRLFPDAKPSRPGTRDVYDPASSAIYATQSLDDALGVLEETRESVRPPRPTADTFYVSQTALSLLNPEFAGMLDQEIAEMSYEEYSKRVARLIDDYADKHNLTEKERNRAYGAMNLYTKAGKEGWVVLDQNEDYILFANQNVQDRGSNANVATVEEALAAFKDAVGQQYWDRTGKVRKGQEDEDWATRSYHDPAYRNAKDQDVDAKAYPREGSVIFSYMETDPKTGKKVKRTDGLGRLTEVTEDNPSGRFFLPSNRILENADAFSIDVNSFFKKHRVNFTLERNYGQAKYGELDVQKESTGTESDPDTILHDMTREVNTFSRLIDDPSIAEPSRQNLARHLLDALVKQTQRDITDMAERFKNGVYEVAEHSDKLKEYTDLRNRLTVLKQMKVALGDASKLIGNEVADKIRRFYDSLAAVDDVEAQLGYDGFEEDLETLDAISNALTLPENEKGEPDLIKEGSGVSDFDKMRMLMDRAYYVRDKITRSLEAARVSRGGGALLVEYDRRIDKLRSDIARIEADDSRAPAAKEAILNTLREKLNRHEASRHQMVKDGVTLDSPSRMETAPRDSFTYNLEGMSLSQLARLRTKTAENIANENRKMARTGNGDSRRLAAYEALFENINKAMKTKPLPGRTKTSVRSSVDGEIRFPEAKPGMSQEEANALRAELFPGRSFDEEAKPEPEAPAVVKPESPQDSAQVRQSAISLLEEVLGSPFGEIDLRLAKYALPRLYAEAQDLIEAYVQEGVMSRDAAINILHEAESLLMRIANPEVDWNKMFGIEEPTEVSENEPSGDGRNGPESGESNEALDTFIADSSLDENTASEAQEQAKLVTKLMATPSSKTYRMKPAPVVSDTKASAEVSEPTSVASVGAEPSVEQKSSEPAEPAEPTPVAPPEKPAVLYDKPTDVRSARETIAQFSDELPMQPEPEVKSTLERLLDELNAQQKPRVNTNVPPSIRSEIVPDLDVLGTSLQQRAEEVDRSDPDSFSLSEPKTMEDILILQLKRDSIGRKIAEINANIKKLDSDLAGTTLTPDERDSAEATKAGLIEHRDNLKKKRRKASGILHSDDVQRRIKHEEAIEKARRSGVDIYLDEVMNDPEGESARIMARVKAALNKAKHKLYERLGSSDETVISALVSSRTNESLMRKLDIARAITADAHRVEELIEKLENRIMILDEARLYTTGAEKAYYGDNAFELGKQVSQLKTDLANLESAADLYYRDSSPNARVAVYGNEYSGARFPATLGREILEIIKASIKERTTKLGAAVDKASELWNRGLETSPERVFDSFFGEYSPIMTNLFIHGIQKGNTAIKEALDRYGTAIKSSGITEENQAIAHLFAEKQITSVELMELRPDDWGEIMNGIRVFDKAYAELLEEVNSVLTRNGFAPADRRKNYYPHFTEGSSPLMALLGLELNQDTINLQIEGKTKDFRPMKQFSGHLLERFGDKTDYGLIDGARSYIPGVLQIIHQMDNIVRLRQLEEIVRSASSSGMALTPYQANRMKGFLGYLLDFTNNLAGKKTGLDVWAAGALGRGALELIRAFKNKVGLNMTWMNVNTMIAQPVSLIAAAATAPLETAMAMAEVINPKNFRAIQESSEFLRGKYKGDLFPQKTKDEFLRKGHIPMEKIEWVVSTLCIRAWQLQGIRQGLSEAEARVQADRIAYRALGTRNRGESGVTYSEALAGSILQFGREPMNNLQFVVRDIPKMFQKKPEQIGAWMLFAILGYLYNLATGKKTAPDVISPVVNAVRGREEDESFWQTGTEALAGIADYGWPLSADFSSGIANIPILSTIGEAKDVVSRLWSGKFDLADPNTWERIVFAGMGIVPGGLQAERTYRGAKAWIKGYSESNYGDVRFPVAQTPGNLIISTLLGERSTPEGKEYVSKGLKPFSASQNEDFQKMLRGGEDTFDAYKAVRETSDNVRKFNEARNVSKEGDILTGNEMQQEVLKEREGISTNPISPEWFIRAKKSGNMNAIRADQAWHSSGLTGYIPREVGNAIEQGGMRVEVTDEIRAEYDTLAETTFNHYMDLAGNKATPKQIKEAVAKAEQKAKEEIIKKYWTSK